MGGPGPSGPTDLSVVDPRPGSPDPTSIPPSITYASGITAALGEATVGELAAPFELTHQAVSRHVGILRRCGLIHQRVDGQRRPCRLNVERLRELSGWITEQQQEWESRLGRLDEHLAEVQGR